PLPGICTTGARLTLVGDVLVDAVQLVFRDEIDLDFAALALPDDADPRAEGQLHHVLGFPRVHLLDRCCAPLPRAHFLPASASRVCTSLVATAAGAGGAFKRRTSASVSRTDSPRATTSSAALFWVLGFPGP